MEKKTTKDSVKSEKKESVTDSKKSVTTKKFNMETLKSKDARMFFAVVGFIIVLALFALVVFFITRNQAGGDEIGMDIPEGYQVHETDAYKVGFPEGFEGEDQEGSFVIAKEKAEDTEALDALNVSFANMVVSTTSEEDLENSDFDKDIIKNSSCSEYETTLQEQIDAQQEQSGQQDDTSTELEVRNVKVNGANGCEISIVATQGGFEAKVLNYLLINSSDEVYSVVVTSFGQNSEDYDTLLEASRTFMFKN